MLADNHREADMTRVLLVGIEPEAVDYTDPALPPGMNAERIHAGIVSGVEQMTARGWEADVCLIQPDETAGLTLEQALTGAAYDCVVIGGGIRIPPKGFLLFETVVNVIHKVAPNATIAFNTRPEDTADAAARRLPQ